MSQLITDLSGLLPLSEKRKALHQFVGRAKEHEVSKILEDCKDLPSIQLKLLKLLLADKFHRFDLVIELLHDGDKSILSKAVSKRWLYEGEENNLADSEFLLNELFPNVSYICRQKVLNKIGRYVHNEAAVDGIWNAIEQKYGFDVAFPLLPACSKAKISSVIANRKITLSGYQVVQILQKYPNIGLEYFKKNAVVASKMNPFCSPLHYLYKYRRDDFVDLCIEQPHKFRWFKLGRVRSTELIRTYRAKFLQHPTQFTSLLKLDRIQREFSSADYQTLFESMLSKNPAKAMYCAEWKWVNAVPLYKRIDLVNKAFTNKFQINLDQHPEFMDAEYIYLLPEEKRLSAVEWKIKNADYCSWSLKGVSVYTSDEEGTKRGWLLLKPTSHSVPELEKLFLIEQDLFKRAKLCKYLIQTCYINDDLPQLLQVLILLNKKIRNDEKRKHYFLSGIFIALSVVMEGMEFSKEHWDNIVEMIQVWLVLKDTRSDDCHKEIEMLVRKCLAFHLKSKLPVDKLIAGKFIIPPLVTMHIKLKIQCDELSWKNSYIEDPVDRRTILELYVKELENLQLTNNLIAYNSESLSDRKLSELIVSLIHEIWLFNVDESAGKLKPILISSHPWLVNNLERIAKEEEARVDKNCEFPDAKFSWKFVKQLLEIIEWLRENEDINLDVFNDPEYLISKKLICSPNHSSILYFLQKNPPHLIGNWSISLSRMLETRACASLMRKLKLWNYATIVDQSINDCAEIIGEELENITEVNVKRKCNAVLVLSVLEEPSDFLILVAEFNPPEKKVDVSADKSGEHYKIRETIAKALININVPRLTFEPLKKFCVGDYLKLTVDSMYSQICRASSVETLNYLRAQLTNVPVSLQKHIIRLYFRITSADDRINILKQIESSNVSIRHVVFLETSRIFRSNPSREAWTMLKTIIEGTTVDDALTLKVLYSEPKLDSCPLEHLEEYIDACLSLLRNLQPKKVTDFMANIAMVMEKVSEKTLDDIVMYDLDNIETFNSDFCFKYLEFSSSESTLEHRLSNMWIVLSNVIERGWNKEYSGVYCPTRSLVSDFTRSLCEDINDPAKSWLKNTVYATLLENFISVSTTKFFHEILYLKLALLLAEVETYSGIERLKRFGRSLARFIDSLVEEYGGDIIFVAESKVKSYIKSSFSCEFNRAEGIVELVDEILQTSKTRQNQILSKTLLNDVKPDNENDANLIEILEKVNKVLDESNGSNDVIVQIHASAFTR